MNDSFNFVIMSCLFLFSNSCSRKIVSGCMDKNSCNFNLEATQNEPSLCSYAIENYDCDNICQVDENKDLICDYTLDEGFEEGDLFEIPSGIFSVQSDKKKEVEELRHKILEEVLEEKETINYYYIIKLPGDDSVSKKVNNFLKTEKIEKILVLNPMKKVDDSSHDEQQEIIYYPLEKKEIMYSPLDEGETIFLIVFDYYIKIEGKSDHKIVFSIGENTAEFTSAYVFDALSDDSYEVELNDSQSLVVFLGGVTVLVGDDLCSLDDTDCKKEEKKVVGCMDNVACNYNAKNSYDDGSCVYAEKYYDCNHVCLNDKDGDGVCDELEIAGCAEKEACNYNELVTDHDDSCYYEKTWYSDTVDKDNLGDQAVLSVACDQPENYVLDANDNNPDCHIDRTDVCAVCDGPGLLTWYLDIEGDLLGDPDDTIEACDQPDGYVENSDDLCPNDSENDGDQDGTCGCTLDDCSDVLSYDYCDDNPTDQGDDWYLDEDGDGSGDSDQEALRVCGDPSTEDNSYYTNQDDLCPNNSELQTTNGLDVDFDDTSDCDDSCPYDYFNDIDSDNFCYCTLYDCSSVESFEDCPNNSDLSFDENDADSDLIPDCVDACANGYSFDSSYSVSSFKDRKDKSGEDSNLGHYVLRINLQRIEFDNIKVYSDKLVTGNEALDRFFLDHKVFSVRKLYSSHRKESSFATRSFSALYRFSSEEPEEDLFCDLEPLEGILWYEKSKKVYAFDVPYPPADYRTPRGDWNLGKILEDNSDGTDAWDFSTGEGITVAVLDTGVSDGGTDGFYSLLQGYDFIDYDRFPEDEESHGTHVAGTIGQLSNNSILGRAGVAPESSIMPIRVLDENGSGSTESVSLGIYWAVDFGADIINMSLGFADPDSDSFSTLLSDAVDYAEENGVIIVAAVGNDAYEDTIAYPAAFEEVVAVGATDKNNNVSSYSNQGEEIDLVAPGGDDIDNDLNNGIIQETIVDCSYGYYSMEGTSQATPHVSATLALLLSYSKENSISLTLDDLRNILIDTALDIGDSGFDHASGYGLVQSKEALDYLISGGYNSLEGEKEDKLEVLDFKLRMTSSNRGYILLKTNRPTDVSASIINSSFSSLKFGVERRFKRVHRVPFFYNGTLGSLIRVQLVTKAGEKQVLRKTLFETTPISCL